MALLLEQAGHQVTLYEQAPAFSRLGAGIQLGPNVLKIMRRLGLEERVEAMGSLPPSWISRDGYDNRVLADVSLNRRRDHYRAAYVTIHRGDFHRVLIEHLPESIIRFDHRLVGLEQRGDAVALRFGKGYTAEADLVIAADGVNSMVREVLLGPEKPLYSGYVGFRASFPATALVDAGLELDPCVKWWTDDRHLMAYYLDAAQTEMYYVTGVPEPDWPHDGAFVPSSREEMREAFRGFNPTVQAVIEASGTITKWPLLTRPPLELWSRGRVVMLGDACHPMKPHMAQGAAMAIEDAAMLSRCLTAAGMEHHERAFTLYRANRMERASRVQRVSNANTWLRTEENPDWVYGYDVFAVPLPT
jgi:6-hydroxynicotinate 3-monooxygenase